MDIDRLTVLSFKYISGDVTAEERTELDLFLADPINRLRFEEIISKENFQKELPLWQEAEAREEGSLVAIKKQIGLSKKTAFIFVWRKWGLAAAAIAAVAFGFFIYRQPGHRDASQAAAVQQHDFTPGSPKATLTLATGKQIILDDAKAGELVRQANSKISKLSNGVISYSTALTEKSLKTQEEVSYNTLTVPKGGTYELVLPDHSIVYLNSASSLKYPTAFGPLNRRVVELSGEAFFVIQKDPARPFQVKVKGKIIDVLGTNFNINAYEDEPSLNATLLEGAITVSDEQHSLLLHPGQQARITDERLQLFTDVDTASIIAWKNGDFRFRSTPIDQVMRQLSRWYNVEVVYTGDKPTQRLTAVVSRNLPASDVIKALEISGYHFAIVGERRIEVMP